MLCQCQPLNAEQLKRRVDYIEEHFAEIEIARRKAESTRYELERAIGEFDPILSSKNFSYLDSFYSGNSNQVTIKKKNRLLGSSVELGYRNGSGNFPVYEDEYKTSNGGEFFTALTIPVLRNFQIDKARLGEKVAQLKVDIGELQFLEKKQKIFKDFYEVLTDAFEVSSNIAIIDNQVALLKQRKSIIKEQVELGVLPANDKLEVQRFLLKNQSDRINFENVSLKALNYLNQVYLREPSVEIQKCQLTISKPRILHKIRAKDIFYQEAIRTRPDLAVLNTATEILQKKLDFDRNQQLPELSVRFEYEDGTGSGALDDTQKSLKGIIGFEYPIFNRKARASVGISSNKLLNVISELKNTTQIVKTAIYDFHQDVITSTEQLSIFKQEIELVEKLLEADRENYKLGNRDLFQVNQRQNILIDLSLKANAYRYKAIGTYIKLLLFNNEIDRIPATIF